MSKDNNKTDPENDSINQSNNPEEKIGPKMKDRSSTNDKNEKTVDNPFFQAYNKLKDVIHVLAVLVVKLIDKLIPPFAPKIIIEEKLIPNEEKLDYTLIRHYNEFQILFGFVLIILGFYLMGAVDGLLWIMSLLGVILVLTGFDIEEIYVTSIRLIIRRISFVERIIRVPSDEEHLLEHVVSFNVGRAPMNLILVILSIIGPLFIAFREINEPEAIEGWVVLLLLIISIFVLVLGMRLGRRSLAISLAGGHIIVMGIRKGIPEHILHSLIKSVYDK